MKRDDQYFFIGLISFVIALFLVPLSCYLVPAAFFNYTYQLPGFIVAWAIRIQATFDINFAQSLVWLVRLFFIPGFFFGALAYFTANRLTRNIEIYKYLHEKDDEASVLKLKQERRDFLVLFFKGFGITVLIFTLIRMAARMLTS